MILPFLPVMVAIALDHRGHLLALVGFLMKTIS
jgi:hypothetical protein